MKTHIDKFIKKMTGEGLPALVTETFSYYYNLLLSGNTGHIPESEISPLEKKDAPYASDLGKYRAKGIKNLANTAILKLNGGLGTTMGLSGPKSLLKIRGRLNFLDIVLAQRESAAKQYGVNIPLILMNSFNTHGPTLAYLEQTGMPDEKMPTCFLQHKYPKVLKETLEPAIWPSNPEKEWNPPGHGNIYTALLTSGTLDRLAEKNIRYVFISNVDNLGAWIDMDILGYFAESRTAFMMEVVKRTGMDRKGGHLARRKSGIVLRELAQTPENEFVFFQDINRYCFFNTNNIWIDIEQVRPVLEKSEGVPRVPMILNEKKLDAGTPGSPDVYQIETAMGAAINLFENSGVVETGRIRFSPVKRSEELLVAWSDYYRLNDDFSFDIADGRKGSPINVRLDPVFYGTCDKMRERFPYGPPSLAQCEFLAINGDVRFEKEVIISGRVNIENRTGRQVTIPPGTVIGKDMIIE